KICAGDEQTVSKEDGDRIDGGELFNDVRRQMLGAKRGPGSTPVEGVVRLIDERIEQAHVGGKDPNAGLTVNKLTISDGLACSSEEPKPALRMTDAQIAQGRQCIRRRIINAQSGISEVVRPRIMA